MNSDSKEQGKLLYQVMIVGNDIAWRSGPFCEWTREQFDSLGIPNMVWRCQPQGTGFYEIREADRPVEIIEK